SRRLQIDGGCLADRKGLPRTVERVLVLLQGPDRETVELRVAVEEATLVIQAEGEEVRLLDRSHEHLRMIGEVPVERGRPRLRRADHDEVRKGHGPRSRPAPNDA